MRQAYRRLIRAWNALLWRLATWLAARRRPRAMPEEVARQVYRQQTQGMGLRLTEYFRDRLRPGWLRLRRSTIRTPIEESPGRPAREGSAER